MFFLLSEKKELQFLKREIKKGECRQKPEKVADVSGAGDTVISTLTIGLAAGANIYEACFLANYAAGIVCGEVGIVPIEKETIFENSFKRKFMSSSTSLSELKAIRLKLKAEGKKVVFTNGVFDLIHSGHLDYLSKAKKLGDVLIVGLNSDDSVRRIKGNERPILKQKERAFILSNLKPVDFVVFFDEDTPEKLISEIIPDILVKGADWSIDKIVGREIVEKNGGKVMNIEFVNDQSTSKIIELIVQRYSK